jgi:Ribbon-helix-helix protein, copG family
MRTTVSIDDYLLAAAKEAARRRGTTLGELVEDALRRALAEPVASLGPAVPIFRDGKGLRPGVPFRSNRDLTEFLERQQPDATD